MSEPPSGTGATSRRTLFGATSRRTLLGGAGTALAGAGGLVLAACGGAGHAAVRPTSSDGPPPLRPGDVRILSAALELERRTVAAYVAGIPLLGRAHGKAAKQYLSEELEHTGELISLIKAAGGKAAPPADSYDIGPEPRDGAEVLTLLHLLEDMQITLYLRAVPQLSPGVIRAAAATILTVDSQHIAMLRVLRGQAPVPAAFVSGSE